MGARPIAALNSLRFGELDNPRTKFLLNGVVEGISHYGNCFGVPTVGGEIYFDECYFDNPLVNAMAVGIVKTDQTASAAANGVGNPVMIVGSSTGRDGIHGASLLASREFDEKTEDMRPTVQVGDPFAEKLLLEATLELIKAGVVVGIQDMGAAGISCSTSEMSARFPNIGMHVDLDKVPLREKDMTAYEIMLSESQERMLVVIEKGKEEQAKQICAKWDVPITEIGFITNDGDVNVFRNGKFVSKLEADHLVLGGGAPVNDRPAKKPAYLKETSSFDTKNIESKYSDKEVFEKLISTPNIASKRWIFEQYDSQVRTNTVAIKGDAAVLRIKEIENKGIAVCTDCNSRYAYLNPYRGGLAAVSEAARNVVCTGAVPVAITNCLNFGNPYDPEVYWQFKEVIRGMGAACRAFDTPVTGGNVSFHNESRDRAIYPTPTIGMLGIIDDMTKVMSANFKNEGDFIYILGSDRTEIGGSEYLKLLTGKITGEAPELDLEEERQLHKATLSAIQKGLINSAHDTSEGGIAIALAEKAIMSGSLGCNISLDNNQAALFGESHSRIIVSVSPEKANQFEALCAEYLTACKKIGTVTKDNFSINNSISYTVADIIDLYESAIPNLMKK